MTSVVILIVDVLVALFLVGVVNVFLFDITVAVLLIPLIPLGVIAAIWLIRKREEWKWDREDEASAKSHGKKD